MRKLLEAFQDKARLEQGRQDPAQRVLMPIASWTTDFPARSIRSNILRSTASNALKSAA